jgi:hypothetical protein
LNLPPFEKWMAICSFGHAIGRYYNHMVKPDKIVRPKPDSSCHKFVRLSPYAAIGAG